MLRLIRLVGCEGPPAYRGRIEGGHYLVRAKGHLAALGQAIVPTAGARSPVLPPNQVLLREIREEADEIEAALDQGCADQLKEETGDLLFAVVNLARHVGADPEMALRGTNAKFGTPLRPYRARPGGAGTLAAPSLARRDGGAVE